MSPAPYLVDVPLRWSDMDALGHVNNVQFVRLLEEARVLMLRDWFPAHGTQQPPLLIARTEIDYIAQLRYRPRPVVVSAWVSQIGGASYDLDYQVRDSAEPDSRIYARAQSTQVRFDLEAQRPSRFTPAEREILEGWSAPPQELKRRPAGHR